MTTTEVEVTELQRYQDRVKEARERFNTIVNWHLEAHTQGEVELPYSADDTYCYMTKSEWDFEKHESVVDVEETLARLARVAKFARSKKCKVEKKYDSDFEVDVTISEEPRIVIHYIANREAVCEKKVVGTKVVPAQVIPEKVVEVIEWECEKVSLLANGKES